MIYILQFHIHLGYTGLMERPPLPIRDCKRGHYHEPTEAYWKWNLNRHHRAGGLWLCRECERERAMLYRYGEIRPRAQASRFVTPATWNCGHPRTPENSSNNSAKGFTVCRECKLGRDSRYYYNLPPLAYAKRLLYGRRREGLNRIAARHERLERDLANGTI